MLLMLPDAYAATASNQTLNLDECGNDNSACTPMLGYCGWPAALSLIQSSRCDIGVASS